MIRTILVPTDGSEHANKAVMLAADIAEKYGARLVLLHVLLRGRLSDEAKHMAEVEHLAEGTGASGPFAANIPAGAASALHEAHKQEPRVVLEKLGQHLLEGAKALAKEKGVEQITTEIQDGDPVREILACAEREKANLLVMGSRGLSDIKGLLLGSVSHKISQLAPCTCVTVR